MYYKLLKYLFAMKIQPAMIIKLSRQRLGRVVPKEIPRLYANSK